MKSFKIAEKEYEFNRPTPARLSVVEGMVNEYELFSTIHNMSQVWRDDTIPSETLLDTLIGALDVVLCNEREIANATLIDFDEREKALAGIEREYLAKRLRAENYAKNSFGRFKRFAGEWERFCGEVFKKGFSSELALENLVYPDEVTGAATDFFYSPSERTMERLKESTKTSQAADTQSR